MSIARRTVLAVPPLLAFGGVSVVPSVMADAQTAPADVVAILAPSGTLRIAINFGSPVLAQPDPATGAPRGVSAELAAELGRRLGQPIRLVTYDGAGKVTDAGRQGAWDLCFLAIDPVRAQGILGGFRWSSQHQGGGWCDGGEKAIGSGAAGEVAFAWPARGGTA